MKDTFILCKDWINYTKEMSVEDKASLIDIIFAYQNGLDLHEMSYTVKVVFAHIKNFFDEQNKKYEEKVIKRNQENGKKGGRPKQKKPKKPTGLKETQSEEGEPKEPTGEIVEGTEEPKKFGNEEINEIMEIIKKYNDGVLNGSDGRQRQYAKNLIGKLKKIPSVEDGRYTRQNTLIYILEIIKNDKYYSTKIGSPELIFYNLASLMQACKKTVQSQSRQF